MTLTTRSIPYSVPTYSLTGDLLAYLNCGLQYRYQNRGSLPPSKPVQLWFGQFIHGVMEEAYRRWRNNGQSLPWGDEEIVPIVDSVCRQLTAKGLNFQRYLLLGIAVERAIQSINILGPFLFPLISEAEVKLRGIRSIVPGTISIRQSNYYEVQGIVDVITSLQIGTIVGGNPIARAAQQYSSAQSFEVIVDYKGMRRPRSVMTSRRDWEYQEWQVLTYAWLRSQQPQSDQVSSGILLYLNELVPGVEDMDELYAEIFASSNPLTDIVPTGTDLDALRQWPREKNTWRAATRNWPQEVKDWWRYGRLQGVTFPRMPAINRPLSEDFRLRRCIRVIPVNSPRVQQSLQEFDLIVSDIETCVANEVRGRLLTQTWQPTPREETCTVCDFRFFCPAPGNRYQGPPTAP